jgi:hypothetical protein
VIPSGLKSLQQFRAGLRLGQAENVVLMVRREDRVLCVSSETFGRTNKNMNTLKNSTTALLPSGRSTRPSITLFVTALLLATLASSVAAHAQTATLVVTAINAGRFYGDPNPAFTATITGLRTGDNITAIFSTVADISSPVGDYLIIPTLVDPDGKLSNYTVVINNGTLTVTPAPLSVVADDTARAAGQPNPTFTGSISGVKNGDDITATHDSPATVGSEAGTYPIVPTVKDGSGKISNYAVSISTGTLTVTP